MGVMDSSCIFKKPKIWMEEKEKANSRGVEWFAPNMETRDRSLCLAPLDSLFGQRTDFPRSIETNKVEKLCYMLLFLITVRFFWHHTKRPVSLHGCKAVLEANVKTLCPGTTQCLLFAYFFLGNRAQAAGERTAIETRLG